MILKHDITLLHVLFSVRHSVLAKIWPRMLLTTAFALLVVLLEWQVGSSAYTLTVVPFSLVGVALGVFLGFRANVSYDRFWEGRTLWGRLVNVTRTFTRQLELFLVPPAGVPDAAVDEYREQTVTRLIAYVESFRAMLRNEGVGRAGERLDPAELARIGMRRIPPNALLEILAERLRVAWQRGWIHDYHLLALDASLTELTTIQGGCERIKGTPVPFSYSLLIHRITALYCLLLPIGIVDTVGMVTPLVTFFTAYAFFGLDSIGAEIENPFERDPNDLPLDAISRNIEIDLLQMIGAAEIPRPIAAKNNVML